MLINLLPLRIQSRRRAYQRAHGLSIAACGVCAILGACVVINASIGVIHERAEQRRVEREREKERILSRITTVRAEASKRSAEMKRVARLRDDRGAIYRLLNTIRSVLPEQVRVEEMRFTLNSVLISGEALDMQSIYLFIDKLSQSERAIAPVLQRVSARRIEQITLQRFEIQASYNPLADEVDSEVS